MNDNEQSEKISFWDLIIGMLIGFPVAFLFLVIVFLLLHSIGIEETFAQFLKNLSDKQK